MKWLGSVSCGLGIHKVADWEYVAPSQCRQRGVCLRCNNEAYRTRHNWLGWEYENAHSCLQRQKCGRCGEKQKMTHHALTTFVYEQEKSCLQNELCARCGTKIGVEVRHQWQGLAYESPKTCVQSERCSRCGENANATLAHKWLEWVNVSSQQDSRTCARCEEIEYRPHVEYQNCPGCGGGGRVSCAGCGGKGYYMTTRAQMGWNNTTQYVQSMQPCAVCHGSKGRMKCSRCGGAGKLSA